MAIVNAPLLLNLGCSVGVAGAFVCVSAILSGAVFVRAAFVGFNDSAGGGGFDFVVVGGGSGHQRRNCCLSGQRMVEREACSGTL